MSGLEYSAVKSLSRNGLQYYLLCKYLLAGGEGEGSQQEGEGQVEQKRGEVCLTTVLLSVALHVSGVQKNKPCSREHLQR